jgi:hypothetical protein
VSQTTRGGTWEVAVLAGLPHLLFPLAVPTGLIALYLRSARISENAPMWTFAGLIAVMLALAWRHRWPRWAASWIGYGLIVPWIAPFWLFSHVPVALEGVVPLVQLLLTLVVGLTLAGRDPLSGLLVPLPAVPMAWCWVDSVAAHSAAGPALLMGGGLATALTAAAIVRRGDRQVGIWLVLLANLLTRVPFTAARRSHHDYLLPPLPPTLPGAIGASLRDVVIGAILVTWPLWGWALWERGRQLVARGKRR